MRRWHVLTTAMLAATAVWLTLGCSSNSGVDTSGSTDLNLTSAFGGYTDSDELPAFGDATMAQALGEDPEGEDLDSNDVDSLEHDAHVQVFFLAIRWGKLEEDTVAVAPTDWSGSVEVARGVVRVLRLIRFEHMQDYIVHPRPHRQRLEWVSRTSRDFDGLLLMIISPLDSGEAKLSSANELVFTTGPYSRTFSTDELMNLQEIVDVGDKGNQIAFASREKHTEPCGGGPLGGIWMADRHGNNGHFFGKWMSEEGVLLGHLRGHFGTRPDGKQVFFGKYIGDDGRFHGLIRGEWGVSDDDSASGWFDGVWAGRHGLAVGNLHGEWHSSAEDGGLINGQDDGHGQGHGHGNDDEHRHFDHVKWGRGFFSGWWERACEPPTDSTISGG